MCDDVVNASAAFFRSMFDQSLTGFAQPFHLYNCADQAPLKCRSYVARLPLACRPYAAHVQLAHLRPSYSRFTRLAEDCGRTWPKFDRSCPEFDPCEPHLAQIRLNVGQRWPKFAQLRQNSASLRAKVCPMLAKLGRAWSEFDQMVTFG